MHCRAKMSSVKLPFFDSRTTTVGDTKAVHTLTVIDN